MPEISRFLGVVIRMYFFDHDPPHFHTSYAGTECRISLAPLSLLDGTIPPRVLGLVLEWATLHDDELRDNWQRLQAGQSPRRIAPLE